MTVFFQRPLGSCRSWEGMSRLPPNDWKLQILVFRAHPADPNTKLQAWVPGGLHIG